MFDALQHRVGRRRRTRDRIADVPRGYVVHRVSDTWLVLDGERADQLIQLRLADAQVRRAFFARAPRRGRATTPTVPLSSDVAVVLRRYRHGGLFGRLLGSLFWGPERALTELRVTVAAERAGAPVPHVLCLTMWHSAGPFWSAVIGTREVPSAMDAAEALGAAETPGARIALVRGLGAAIRRLHDAGVEHNDLQLRNLLVAEPLLERIVVVDLDGARFDAGFGLDGRRRARNLGRLVRSAVKLGVFSSGEPAGTNERRRALAALIGGYAGRDRELRRSLQRWAGWERAKLTLHRVGYALRGIRSPETPPRAASPPRPA